MDIYDKLSLIQIKNDCQFIKDLFFFTKDKQYNSILALEILPFISLMLYESNNFINSNIMNLEDIIPKSKNNCYSIKDVRLKVKLFEYNIVKSINAIQNIEYINDRYFKELSGKLFYKNIGLYMDINKNIIGNTHLAYFFYQAENIKKFKLHEIEKLYTNNEILNYKDMTEYSLNYGIYLGELASFFDNLLNDISSTRANYKDINYNILYQDFNTLKDKKIFPINDNDRIVKLYVLHLLSMINSVIYFFKPIILDNLSILLKIEYIVYYYAVKSLKELYKYLKKHKLINADIIQYFEKLNIDDNIFMNSDFRSCMMHYGFKNPKNNKILIKENEIDLKKPYFGLIESCLSIDSNSFEKQLYNKLLNISNTLKQWVDLKINNPQVL